MTHFGHLSIKNFKIFYFLKILHNYYLYRFISSINLEIKLFVDLNERLVKDRKLQVLQNCFSSEIARASNRIRK